MGAFLVQQIVLTQKAKLLYSCDSRYKLPAKYVFHAVGPRGANEEKLASCYQSVLDQVNENNEIRTLVCLYVYNL